MEGQLSFFDQPAIYFAGSVRSVASLEHPLAASLTNRNHAVDQKLVSTIVGQSIFGWEHRNPKPALDEQGNFVGTDLDLLSFMVPMAARRAVIEIPHYRSRRANVSNPNERHVGSSRFGVITGLVSNDKVNSFSVQILDNSIVATDPVTERQTVGKPRNFMLVDIDGEWHEGWEQIIWDPTRAENAFLSEKALWTGNSVQFSYAVHPNRWQSVFGAPYMLLKILVARLDDEARFYRAEVKRLQALGYRFPVYQSEVINYFGKSGGKKGRNFATRPSAAPKSRQLRIETLEAILDLPTFRGEYTPVEQSPEGLAFAYKRQRFLTWKLKPQAQFVIRADELAYLKYGEGRIATWMGDLTWGSFRAYRGRIVWGRLQLTPEVALRMRLRAVTQTVAA